MFKNSGLYNPERNPVGKNRRNVVLAQMAKGNIITEKEKRDSKVYQLLLILNWKAIEKDQQLISESPS
jgi:penicillin-binding protein 1A